MRHLLLILLTACSAVGTKETPNSTVVSDSVVSPDSITETDSTTPEILSDTSQLDACVQKFIAAHEVMAEKQYRINIVTSQYEAGSEVIWYFDENFEPAFFVMSWASEGNEGLTQLFVDGNEVVCAKEESDNAIEQWCSTTGGIKMRFSNEGDKKSKELLPADYAATMNTRFRQYFGVLQSLLKEGEKSEVDKDTWSIKLEEVVNYGVEFTETTEVTIPKKVYIALTSK